MSTLPPTAPMPKVSLRRLLSRLAAIALSTTAIGAASAECHTGGADEADADADVLLTADVPIDPDYIDPPDAAAALGRSLALARRSMRPIEATQLVATWAMSDRSGAPARRRALARVAVQARR